jgi:CheY-like chemotaxis protein
LKLLLIDDHAIFRTTAARMLTQLGHQVVEASNAADAEAVFQREQGQFDALVVDFFLGDGHGTDLVTKLEADIGHTLPVVFMSGDIAATRRAAGAQANLRSFVEKPFTANDIEAVLRDLGMP